MHTVLLVDDEIYFRQGLRELVNWEACGFRVIEEADNGEDAFLRIQELKPDLVVTDIRMPVMDGLELIRKVIEKETHVPRFIIISGYDDFKYAQQAVRFGVVDFILKPVDESSIEETLRKLDSTLREERELRREGELRMAMRLAADLIKGKTSQQQLDEAASHFGIEADDRCYYVFIENNNDHPWNKQEPTISDFFDEHVQKTISELVHRDVILIEHRNRFGWICAESDLNAFGNSIERFAEMLQKRLRSELKTAVRVYAGQPVQGLAELALAYQTAKEALQYRFAVDEESPVLYERIASEKLNFLEPEESMFGELLEAVEEQDEAQYTQLIDELFKTFRENRFAPEAVKMAIHRMVTDVLKVMRDMGIDEREMQSLEPMLGWHDLNVTLGEIRRLFSLFIAESANMIAEQRKETSKGGIQKIKQYIDTHFHENISLKSIAARFYMNPVYLGQLFKKTYGMYFNEYLLKLRVQEAKKMLRQTDMRIYEIAEKVGFSNADYFVTQFEKAEGVTPSEYRNRLLQQ